MEECADGDGERAQKPNEVVSLGLDNLGKIYDREWFEKGGGSLKSLSFAIRGHILQKTNGKNSDYNSISSLTATLINRLLRKWSVIFDLLTTNHLHIQRKWTPQINMGLPVVSWYYVNLNDHRFIKMEDTLDNSNRHSLFQRVSPPLTLFISTPVSWYGFKNHTYPCFQS